MDASENSHFTFPTMSLCNGFVISTSCGLWSREYRKTTTSSNESTSCSPDFNSKLGDEFSSGAAFIWGKNQIEIKLILNAKSNLLEWMWERGKASPERFSWLLVADLTLIVAVERVSNDWWVQPVPWTIYILICYLSVGFIKGSTTSMNQSAWFGLK